jgi:hypothetical protein
VKPFDPDFDEFYAVGRSAENAECRNLKDDLFQRCPSRLVQNTQLETWALDVRDFRGA